MCGPRPGASSPKPKHGSAGGHWRPWTATPSPSLPASAAAPPQPGCPKSKRAKADRCAKYLTNKAEYLDYPTALTSGWPLATGIIEGACRHLVADRMDITGARWSVHGAEAVLKPRAVSANGDLDAYWQYHLDRERQRVRQSRYTNDVLPLAA